MAGRPETHAPAAARPSPGWRGACARVLATWVAALACAFGLVPSAAAADDTVCTRLAAGEATRIARGAGEPLQAALAVIYRGHPDYPGGKGPGAPLADGVIGRVTVEWLARFCRDYAVPDAMPEGGVLAEAAVQFARTLERRREWQRPLRGRALTEWIDAQPAEARRQHRHVRLYGSDGEIEALLAAWTPAASLRFPPENDTELVYYELTGTDLGRLAAPRKVYEALGKLVGKPAMNAEAFETALAGIAKGAGIAPDAATMAVVRAHAEAEDSFQLTADSIQALKVARVPAPIVAIAQSVQDLPYPTLNVLEEALQDAGAAAAPKDAAPTPPGLAAATPPPPAPAPPTLSAYLPGIRAQVATRPIHRITAKTLEAIEADPNFRMLDDYVYQRLLELKDVEYPTPGLFVSAVRARLVEPLLVRRTSAAIAPQADAPAGAPSLPLKMVQMLMPDKTTGGNGSADKFHEVALKSAAELKKMEVPLPADWQPLVERVRTQHFDTGRQLRELLLGALDGQIQGLMAPVIAEARKPHPFRQDGRIQWHSDGCGCVRNMQLPGATLHPGGWDSAGEVYGLFPLWQAGRPQRIDFSVLSSIAYFALPFDNEGRLHDTLDANDEDRLAFVTMARRHGTRVDWGIRHADWSGWAGRTRKEREAIFDRLAGDIEAMLLQTEAGWLRRLASRLTFGAVPIPTRGDGVTLYFPNYPEDDDSVAAFLSFHRRLGLRLEKVLGDVAAVNVLFNFEQLGHGLYQCRHLYTMMGPKDLDRDTLGKFLVLLNEPTGDSKKGLREKLENCATGRPRQELMQNVVPVIEYVTDNRAQLQDDIIYFDFNFGGIALWPHPVGTDMTAPDAATDKPTDKVTEEQVAGDIRKLLLGQDDYDVKADDPVDAGIDKVCTIVCPNRWLFRGLLFVMVLVFAGSLVARWASCRLRFVVASKPLYFWAYLAGIVLPTLLLFLGLLYCDPAWERVREGNLPFLLLAAVFLGYVIWLYVSTRREASRP